MAIPYEEFDEIMPFVLAMHLLNVKDWSLEPSDYKGFSNT